MQSSDNDATTINVDSGHGSMANRRSTPLSQAAGQTTSMASPYSTLGKSYAGEHGVDLLHDKWADLMDQYLDTKFKSNTAGKFSNIKIQFWNTTKIKKHIYKHTKFMIYIVLITI